MSTTKQLSVYMRIADLQADIIDGYNVIIEKSHATEELEMLELEKKNNMVSALRETVGCPP